MARLIPENSGAIRSRVIKQTGPRTARGKAASSRNALKNGLRSTEIVIPGENPRAFNDLLQDIRGDLDPVGPVEAELVDHIVSCMWRLRRARHIEMSIYHFECAEQVRRAEEYEMVPVTDRTATGRQYRAGAGAIETLLRYETKFERSLDRAMDRLKELQSARIADLEPIDVSAEIEDTSR